ncbi:hypothetical protein [Streptomyces sp. BRA346]|uniref:hypothetical protein n=1 Tax=Streptomyces sp. BRA346 TaxID=2878199 RepID=UPI004063E41B
MMPQVCARCDKTTSTPVVVAIEHGSSVGGRTLYACPRCAPTFPKQRDPFEQSLPDRHGPDQAPTRESRRHRSGPSGETAS